MSLETDMVAALKAYPGLSALVATRIYPGGKPQGATLPVLAYNRISTQRQYSHSGYSGLQRPRFQFDLWASTHVDLLTLADQFAEAVHWLPSYGLGAAFIDNEIDMREVDTADWRRAVDVIVWYQG